MLLRLSGLMVWMGVLLLCAPALGESDYSVAYVQGHRCLVVEPEGLPPEAPVVLFLHGFGTNGDEMLALSHRFGLPPCRMVMPDGPLPAQGFPSVDHEWYDRYTHSRRDVEYSREYLLAVMDRFSNEDLEEPGAGSAFPKRPVILVGFSQGAIMALEAGLNYKGRMKAIVAISGYIPEPKKTLAHPQASKTTSILLIRGSLDPVIQDGDIRDTVAALKRAGYRSLSREFRGGHHLTYAAQQEVSQFLQMVLDK